MSKEFPLQARTSFQGIPISIENKRGSTRSGIDPDGAPWSIKMSMDYGYIRGGVLGADHEELDVYLGRNRTAKNAYIVRQHKIEEVKKWGGSNCPNCQSHAHDCSCPQFYDEDKVMLGYDSEQAAKAAYLSQYDNELFLGPISTVSMSEFRRMVLIKGVYESPHKVLKESVNTSLIPPNNHSFTMQNELEEGGDSILDSAVKMTKKKAAEKKKSFSGAVSMATNFAQIKARMLVELQPSKALKARENDALKTLTNPNADLDELSSAVFVLEKNGHKSDDLIAANTRLKKEVEPRLLNAGVELSKSMSIFDKSGKILPELKALTSDSTEYINRMIDELSGLNDLWRSPSVRYDELKKADVRDKYKKIEAELDLAKGNHFERQEALAEFGKVIIARVLEASPVSESEALRWAKSQEIDKAAKATISKTHSMAGFIHDLADFYRLCGGRLSYVNIVDVNHRAHASGDNTYNLGGKADRSVLFHELTHIMERSPSLRAAANSFLDRRTKGDSLESLKSLYPNSNYSHTEVTLKDNFYHPYMGKVYPHGSTEIFTMLTQELADPARAAKLAVNDPESFQFAVGMLSSHTNAERDFSAVEAEENLHVSSYRKQLLAEWDEVISKEQSFSGRGAKSVHSFKISDGPNKGKGLYVAENKKPKAPRAGARIRKTKSVSPSVIQIDGGVVYGLSSPKDAAILAMQFIKGVSGLDSETDIHTYNGGNYISIKNIPTEALGE